tara:strand:+ start:2438 stop:2818 length:381 start_codon:yes stop_codon:yes gene_type:complete
MGNSKKQNIRFVMPSDVSPHSSEPLLTICGDLICLPDENDMVCKIGILGKKKFRSRPESCPCCEKDAIMGVEVLGAYPGILLWQCMKCDERFLRFGKKVTSDLLLKVKDTYTCPEDWGYTPRHNFS